jgi:hypothetical protein
MWNRVKNLTIYILYRSSIQPLALQLGLDFYLSTGCLKSLRNFVHRVKQLGS